MGSCPGFLFLNCVFFLFIEICLHIQKKFHPEKTDEIVTSTPEENESKTYDDKHLDNDHFINDEHVGMDRKYFILLESIHKKIQDEDNDVPLLQKKKSILKTPW